MIRPFLSYRKQKDTWYIYWYDAEGVRHASPTGKRLKGEATLCLRMFNPPDAYPSEPVTPTAFHEEFNAYSEEKYTDKSQKHFSVAMRKFIAATENKLLTEVDIKDCQLFLAKVERTSSIWSARKYYTALASVFERAKEWGRVKDNIWRKVQKLREGEREVIFFSRETVDKFLKVVREPVS